MSPGRGEIHHVMQLLDTPKGMLSVLRTGADTPKAVIDVGANTRGQWHRRRGAGRDVEHGCGGGCA